MCALSYVYSAIAAAIYLARIGSSKESIREYIAKTFAYDMERSFAQIRDGYEFQVYAIWSSPEAIICFLESDSYEDCVRNAISLGSDADTQASMAGAIAEAYYGKLPGDLLAFALQRLDQPLLDTMARFCQNYVNPKLKARSQGER